jgi:hypothetical protein
MIVTGDLPMHGDHHTVASHRTIGLGFAAPRFGT